ncbi:hypothetical protein VC83_01847 [Pseudogymnoascus destructans]|uniref:CCHC-type domain-containing protein n=2 Tax=Pseudogymnoascus destructans TaxID=655981 RepID=L8G8M9_PSED2|nr:uncharacterized protein VC83_01847 [Pseudogymnoascus destructans]ELR09209.1 hypothetical protein GMDG_03783 [Pseudogymnoascus destructans 20631-21]OAF61656.1 hypothetical protein VC83_01847 [Pseudogymnoascus destructans]
MVSLIEHTVRINNQLYEFQKERRTYDSPKKSYKYRGNEGRKKENYSRDNRWPDPMKLDATFKQGNRLHNPDKEQQLKERLCFNCNKPGQLARNCKQPKKGNGGRKYGKQLNATWQGQGGYDASRGQLCATLKGKENWSVTTQDLKEFYSSNGEDKNDDKELTTYQKDPLQAFEKTASKNLFKEQLPGTVRTFKDAMLQETVDQGIPVPKTPTSWQDTTQVWEVAVPTMRCQPKYPHQQELRGAKYTEMEATIWLEYKLCKYNVRDAIADWGIFNIYHPKKEVYETRQNNLLQVLQQLEQEGEYEASQLAEIWTANE